MTTSTGLAFVRHDNVLRAQRSCFAPFEKGGYGGFALRVMQGQEQKQISLDPPFTKGEKSRALRGRPTSACQWSMVAGNSGKTNGARRSCFAPFIKVGHGGFALRVMPGQVQKQTPLDPPFAKVENKPDFAAGVIPRATGMSLQVAA